MFHRDCPFCVSFSQNYLNTDLFAMGFLLAQLHFLGLFNKAALGEKFKIPLQLAGEFL